MAGSGRASQRETSMEIRMGGAAACHRHAMRAHVLEEQIAEFPGAIASELARLHYFARESAAKYRRMRYFDV
jgi:hypothetical protein